MNKEFTKLVKTLEQDLLRIVDEGVNQLGFTTFECSLEESYLYIKHVFGTTIEELETRITTTTVRTFRLQNKEVQYPHNKLFKIEHTRFHKQTDSGEKCYENMKTNAT